MSSESHDVVSLPSCSLSLNDQGDIERCGFASEIGSRSRHSIATIQSVDNGGIVLH